MEDAPASGHPCNDWFFGMFGAQPAIYESQAEPGLWAQYLQYHMRKFMYRGRHQKGATEQ